MEGNENTKEWSGEIIWFIFIYFIEGRARGESRISLISQWLSAYCSVGLIEFLVTFHLSVKFL